MRSVHTAGSDHAHRARTSDTCVAPSGTDASVISRCIGRSTIHFPAPLCSTGVTPHRSSYGCSDSSAFVLGRVAAPPSLGECGGLPSSRTPSSDHSASNHRATPGHRFSRLVGTCLDRTSDEKSEPAVIHLSHQRVRLIRGFALRSQARRVAGPNRVRKPADWSFASRYSPPRLAATQLRLASEVKTPFRSGLTPLGRGTPKGVRARVFLPACRAPRAHGEHGLESPCSRIAAYLPSLSTSMPSSSTSFFSCPDSMCSGGMYRVFNCPPFSADSSAA